jgi:glycosyltransferase involved in cell wall biosynthesis
MNLLFVIPTFRKWGGVNEAVVALAEHFDKQGNRVVIASEDPAAVIQARLTAAHAYYRVPLKRRSATGTMRNVLNLLRIVRRERINLISSHQYKTTVVCKPVGWALGIPVVHSAHVQMGRPVRLAPSLGRHVTANCEGTRDYVVRNFNIARDKVTVIWDAARVMSAPQPEQVERVRAEFGVSPGKPVLVCVGRLSPEKGHAVLLRALVAIREQFPSIRLLVVGSGHLRRELQLLSDALGLGNAVTFTGYRYADAAAIICIANVAVHPSSVDAFPMSNVECVSLGVPVVTTTLPGITEVFRHGETALLVPANDAGALADAVVSILRSPELGRSMVERAQKEVVSRFDPSVMCQAYEKYFASVLAEVRPGWRGVGEGLTVAGPR